MLTVAFSLGWLVPAPRCTPTPAHVVRSPQPQARLTLDRVVDVELDKAVEAARTSFDAGWLQVQAQMEGFEKVLADAAFTAQATAVKARRATAEATQAQS